MTAAGTLWHITLLVAGAPVEGAALRRALQQLCDRDPGNMGARFRVDGAELQFWDEGHDIEQVTRAALSLWPSDRRAVGLPDWALVGIQVLDRNGWRERRAVLAAPIAPGTVMPVG